MKKRLLFLSANLMFLVAFCLPAAASAAPSATAIHGQHGRTRLHLRNGTSSNWSGYAAYGAAGAFNSVSASWVQPSVTCTTKTAYSSFWVGLDGYNDNTVEQLGTEADCSHGKPSYYAWYEMYPSASYKIKLPISAGNSFSASVNYSSKNTFTLAITNNSQHKSFSASKKLARAGRSSAEAIAEAPSSWSGVLPLTNFGTASFTNTLANGNPIGNYTTDPLTMDNPYGMVSTPSGLTGGTDFLVVWSD